MNHNASQQGFAFVELLVSVVIIGFGLLAVSMLQTNALQSTRLAYLRASAGELALAYAERVRANTGDNIYVYDEDNNLYRLASAVGCYFNAASGTDPSDAAAMCTAVTAANASQAAIATADDAAMDTWVSNASSVLPGGSWSLNLMRNGVVASGIAAASCNYSLASGSAANQPCSFQVVINWQDPRTGAASLGYVFR
ncbi:MAG: prepilin-type N-terminal cleavage/methylation domain-containing protein [Vogesella sp.]|uniref:prepilin-type N-terminal cleavage/methylation domain-containing protein n=1 Tax=Vogesella sp. TaxID=1904252 RepID=UPI00391BAB28